MNRCEGFRARTLSDTASACREPIAIAVAGGAARAVLGKRVRGRVLAVFRRSFYVAFGDDVVCVGSPQLGLGPLNLLCARRDDTAWVDDGVGEGADVACNRTTLDVGRGLRFDFGTADIWQPPLPVVASPAAIRIGLALVACSVRERRPGGLGAILAQSAHAGDDAAWDHDDALGAAAWPAIRSLREGLAAAFGGAASLPSITALVGLGPGLTPSGDDFLGGLMIALHYFGRHDVARHVATAVLPVAARETSLISAAYLRCAARGEGARVLFDVLECIAAGDGAPLEARLDAIDGIGHTSGWDSLAGAALACDVLQDSARNTSTATSAACAFDGATTTPASSSSSTCRE